jgi:hypothetical protein
LGNENASTPQPIEASILPGPFHPQLERRQHPHF